MYEIDAKAHATGKKIKSNIDLIIKYGLVFAVAWLAFFVIFDRHISLGLHLGLGLGLLYFIRQYRQQQFSWPILIPLLPIMAICLTAATSMLQGEESGDFRYAWMGLSIAITGMAASSALPRKTWMPMMFLPIAITTITIFYFLQGGLINFATRLSTPIRGPFYLGLLAGFCVLIYLGNLRDMNRRYKIVFFLPAFLVPLIILSLTGCRSIIAALGVSIAVYVLFFADHKRITIPLCLAGILIACFFFSKSQVRIHRLNSSSINKAMLLRMSIWDVGLQGFWEKPIFGHQKSNFKSYYRDYIKEKNKKRMQKYLWMQKIKPFPRINYTTPHNIYIGILFSWGIIGFIAFAGTTVPIIITMLKEQYIFPFLALLYISCSGLFDFYIHTKAGLFIIFIVCGLAAGRHWGTKPLDKQKSKADINHLRRSPGSFQK